MLTLFCALTVDPVALKGSLRTLPAAGSCGRAIGGERGLEIELWRSRTGYHALRRIPHDPYENLEFMASLKCLTKFDFSHLYDTGNLFLSYNL